MTSAIESCHCLFCASRTVEIGCSARARSGQIGIPTHHPDRQLGYVYMPFLQVHQELASILGEFTHPFRDREQCLVTALINANDHQSAELAGRAVHAPVDAGLPAACPSAVCKRVRAPSGVFIRPFALQARDDSGRQGLWYRRRQISSGFRAFRQSRSLSNTARATRFPGPQFCGHSA